MSYDISFQARVFPLLMAAFPTALSPVFTKVAYSSPSQNETAPFCVFHSQDGGGKNDDRLSQNGWSGYITFKSVDTTKSGADNRLYQIPALLESTTISGYGFQLEVKNPIPPMIEKFSDKTLYSVGFICKVSLYK